MKHFPHERTEELLSWLSGLAGSDDRILIIVAAAKMDDQLLKLLQKKLVHQPGNEDGLFDTNRPLASLSSRVLLAYRLGLIDRDFERFLQTLRRLRNAAAHSAEPMDLTAAPYIDWLTHLQELASKCEIWGPIADTDRPVVARANPSMSLLLSLQTALFVLECALINANPYPVDDACGFHTIKMKAENDDAAADATASS